MPTLPGPKTRPKQMSSLLSLPTHILIQIAYHLLADLPPNTLESDSIINRVHHLLPPSAPNDLLALLRSCAEMRYLDIPPVIWKLLVLEAIARYTASLLKRWRANPTGVGTASNLCLALDEAFTEPLRVALSLSFPAREVWRWWTYDEKWRSRRRVWYCVVHACSTARDADRW